MGLSYFYLEKAYTTLLKAIELEKNDIVRDSVIQRFEYCYELCWKALRKQLVAELGELEIDGISRRELFRKAQGQKIISSADVWQEFHLARNSTSHNYNEENSESVFDISIVFSGEMKKLIEELKKRGWQENEPH